MNEIINKIEEKGIELYYKEEQVFLLFLNESVELGGSTQNSKAYLSAFRFIGQNFYFGEHKTDGIKTELDVGYAFVSFYIA